MKSKKVILRLAKLNGACADEYNEYKNARGKENYNVLLRYIDVFIDEKILIASDIKWLIEHGANVHIHDDLALFTAVRHGKSNIVKWLIEHGADVNARNAHILTVAITNNDLKIVKYLVVNGIDLHTLDYDVILTAIDTGNLEMVRWLIAHGADANVPEYIIRYALIDRRYDIVDFIDKTINPKLAA